MLRISRYLISTIVILMLVAYGTGCAGEKPPPPSPGGPVRDYISLVDNLRATGANIQPAGDITQPFFSVPGRVITVNGSDVQVFEYENTTAADTEATLVSPDGSSVGTSMMSWVAPPHFYKAGKLIVLYVGESGSVIGALEGVLGPQFAGR